MTKAKKRKAVSGKQDQAAQQAKTNQAALRRLCYQGGKVELKRWIVEIQSAIGFRFPEFRAVGGKGVKNIARSAAAKEMWARRRAEKEKTPYVPPGSSITDVQGAKTSVKTNAKKVALFAGRKSK